MDAETFNHDWPVEVNVDNLEVNIDNPSLSMLIGVISGSVRRISIIYLLLLIRSFYCCCGSALSLSFFPDCSGMYSKLRRRDSVLCALTNWSMCHVIYVTRTRLKAKRKESYL